MKQRQSGSVAIHLLMAIATVAVSLGVGLALYPAEERTPSFGLSLLMLCFAECCLFAFPIYHSTIAADRRSTGFTFGFGFQSALAIYMGGVILLSLLSGVGSQTYSLVERGTSGTGQRVQVMHLRGEPGERTTFDGFQQADLAQNRRLEAGASHTYDIDVSVQADAATAPVAGDCSTSGAGFVSHTAMNAGDSPLSADDCVSSTAIVQRSGDLEIAKQLVAAPLLRSGSTNIYDLRYRVEVRNTRWFMSFRTLVILHTVWLLLLILTTGLWRMGSTLATNSAVIAKSQRVAFAQVRARLNAFAANVSLERSPAMLPFVSVMKSLQDDVAHATTETPPGTESCNGALMSALELLGAEYSRLRSSMSTGAPEERDVAPLVDKAKDIAVIVRQRDAAIKAAR